MGTRLVTTSQTKAATKDVRGGISKSLIDSEGNRVDRCRSSRNCADFAVIGQPAWEFL
jgi:hypothetical protein